MLGRQIQLWRQCKEMLSKKKNLPQRLKIACWQGRPSTFQSVCAEIHKCTVWSYCGLCGLHQTLLFFYKTFQCFNGSAVLIFTPSVFTVCFAGVPFAFSCCISWYFSHRSKANVNLLKYCFKLLETPYLLHVLICNFAHSVWTWVNAPRFMTWHCGLIMSWPASQKITTMTLM